MTSQKCLDPNQYGRRIRAGLKDAQERHRADVINQYRSIADRIGILATELNTHAYCQEKLLELKLSFDNPTGHQHECAEQLIYAYFGSIDTEEYDLAVTRIQELVTINAENVSTAFQGVRSAHEHLIDFINTHLGEVPRSITEELENFDTRGELDTLESIVLLKSQSSDLQKSLPNIQKLFIEALTQHDAGTFTAQVDRGIQEEGIRILSEDPILRDLSEPRDATKMYSYALVVDETTFRSRLEWARLLHRSEQLDEISNMFAAARKQIKVDIESLVGFGLDHKLAKEALLLHGPDEVIRRHGILSDESFQTERRIFLRIPRTLFTIDRHKFDCYVTYLREYLNKIDRNHDQITPIKNPRLFPSLFDSIEALQRVSAEALPNKPKTSPDEQAWNEILTELERSMSEGFGRHPSIRHPHLAALFLVRHIFRRGVPFAFYRSADLPSDVFKAGLGVDRHVLQPEVREVFDDLTKVRILQYRDDSRIYCCYPPNDSSSFSSVLQGLFDIFHQLSNVGEDTNSSIPPAIRLYCHTKFYIQELRAIVDASHALEGVYETRAKAERSRLKGDVSISHYWNVIWRCLAPEVLTPSRSRHGHAMKDKQKLDFREFDRWYSKLLYNHGNSLMSQIPTLETQFSHLKINSIINPLSFFVDVFRIHIDFMDDERDKRYERFFETLYEVSKRLNSPESMKAMNDLELAFDKVRQQIFIGESDA